MAVITEFDARLVIKAFIDRANRPYADWYAGTAVDARTHVLEVHHVNEEHDWWIAEQIDSPQGARNVEQFLAKLGCNTGFGDGDPDAAGIYAYAREPHTAP
jgi:hypothetical protein